MLCKVNKIILLLWIIFYFSCQGYAHKINLFVLPMENKLEIKAFFGDGSPCKNCLIKILDEKGKIVAQANTDEEGRTIIYPSKLGNLKVVLYAGEGHFAEKEITLASTKESEKRLNMKKIEKNMELYKRTDKEKILEEITTKHRELEEEIIALRREIENLRGDLQKVKIQDIIGALGYIIGVFGLLSLLKKRNAS